ncbi:MAG: hypothetical protein AAF412_08710 [Pseudomonadota bacterium]
MNRRRFLQSIGASALLPALPLPASILASPSAAAVSVPAFSDHTYQWAEMIVRAHNKCNLGLLQRSLRIDASAALALKDSLIKNGIVSAKANAYGIHTATKPLYEGAFISVSETLEKVKAVDTTAPDHAEENSQQETLETNAEHQPHPKIESETNGLQPETESESDEETDDSLHLAEGAEGDNYSLTNSKKQD